METTTIKHFIIEKPVGREKSYTVMIAPDRSFIKEKVDGVKLNVTEITEAEYNVLVKYIPNYFHQKFASLK